MLSFQLGFAHLKTVVPPAKSNLLFGVVQVYAGILQDILQAGSAMHGLWRSNLQAVSMAGHSSFWQAALRMKRRP